jgi:hypothetical protein
MCAAADQGRGKPKANIATPHPEAGIAAIVQRRRGWPAWALLLWAGTVAVESVRCVAGRAWRRVAALGRVAIGAAVHLAAIAIADIWRRVHLHGASEICSDQLDLSATRLQPSPSSTPLYVPKAPLTWRWFDEAGEPMPLLGGGLPLAPGPMMNCASDGGGRDV